MVFVTYSKCFQRVKNKFHINSKHIPQSLSKCALTNAHHPQETFNQFIFIMNERNFSFLSHIYIWATAWKATSLLYNITLIWKLLDEHETSYRKHNEWNKMKIIFWDNKNFLLQLFLFLLLLYLHHAVKKATAVTF